MAKKVAKRMGRPVTTGIRPLVGVRFSKEALGEIDRYAKANKISRSEAIRQLVERSLEELKP
jgi:metal-responsive CopG/Arc/MetJ family transcriptional regulator